MEAQITDPRIQKLEAKLDSLSTEVPGLFKPMDFSIGETQLSNFIRAVSVANSINVSLDPNLSNVNISQSFKDATAKNILLNLCKDYSLTIEVFGNILAIKKYKAPYVPRDIQITYNQQEDLFTADFQQDSLIVASRKITEVTGKNVMYTLGLEKTLISAYIKDMPFEAAIDKIALTNNLEITKTKDNFYLFIPKSDGITRRKGLTRRGNFNYQVLDTVNKLLEVDFVQVPIEAVINDLAFDLNINMATSEPLQNIGNATIKSDSISFDNLLTGLLENTKFTYKLEDGMYFFGKQELASVEDVEVVTLMNRSIQTMMEPMQASGNFNGGNQFSNTFSQNGSFNNGGFNNGGFNQQGGLGNQNFNRQQNQNRFLGNQRTNSVNNGGANDGLDKLFPEGIIDSLKISLDVEQNSFLVKGDALKIEKFKKFVKKIDQPVPLVMIEVMLIEVNKSRSVSAGIEWGIGDAPSSDLGDISSNEGLTLGAETINRVIGGFDGIGSLNIGRVVPNFFANIQALETNGDLKIKSTPKLSALNGHVASLVNGQRTYFTQTLVNTFGIENPQQQQFVNFIPIDANLSIKIRPIVSGDGNVTLSIDVMQSSFSTGERVAEGAPPDINTSQFNSTIKVRDKDVVILGGLEVDSKSDAGSGVPFLARIPVIKWLFSKRVRTKSESKLSVMIRPTIIKN
jgi:type IV pilus assembly protein PilQ